MLFTDYFVFILRQLVQAALDEYREYPYQVPPGSTDTLADIAVRFGLADADHADAAVSVIAEANKNSAAFFVPGTTLAVNRRSERVAPAGETLRALATRLQLTPLLVALAIRRDTGVLAVGSTIQVAGGSYVTGEGDTLASIAARLGAPLDAVTGAAAAVPGLLVPLTPLTLPSGSYLVRPPDTLASIAAATGATVSQVGAAAADVTGLLFAGVGFPLPALPWTVAASGADPAVAESLDAIAARFGTTLAALVAGANAGTLRLRPGAPVAFGLTAQTRPGESLGELAARFGLQPADLAAALADQPGLLAPGATLTVNPAAPGAPPASYVIKRGDTLASIAAGFGTSPQAVTAANPQISCQPGQPCWTPSPAASFPRPGMGLSAPVGLRIVLPHDLPYQVGSQDTLAGVAARFGLGPGDLALTNPDIPLAPQVTVVLPPVTCTVAGADTPVTIAARFGLTVEQLVLANQAAAFGTVVVPGAEVLPLSTLVTRLAQAGSFDQPAGALARFLLHGLRLPSPDELPPPGELPPGADPAGQRLYPLYTLTGQQLVPPSPLPDDYGLTLAASGTAPWVTFPGGATSLTVPLSADDQAALAGIAAQLGQGAPIDAGLLAATGYPPCVCVPRQYALGKPVPWQAAVQAPLRHVPPGPPATTTAAVTPAAGQPVLLPFPDALRHQIAITADTAGPGLRVGLASGSKTAPGAPTQTTPIDGFGWATRVDIGLRRVIDPNGAGQPLPATYEVFGVSQDATADLRLLLDYALGAAGGSDTLILALLYPAGVTSAAGPGLKSDPVDPASVLLVKANLSTRSNPPAAASAMLRARAVTPDGAGITAGTMAPADARDFLTLLWEAAVTNTGGYYLYYRVGQDGQGLPAEIFGQDPTATVSLLVTAFPAPGDARSTIPLRAFHNTALVTDNLADPNAAVFAVPPQVPLSAAAAAPGGATLAGLAGLLGTTLTSLGAANAATANLLAAGQAITVGSASHVVAPGEDILAVARALGVTPGDVVQNIGDPRYFTPGASAEVYPEWLSVRGTLQPGAAGFRLLRTDPDPADPQAPRPPSAAQDPRTRLEVLFNLVGYQLVATPGFRASADGLPAGPARQASGPLNHQLTAVGGAEPWIYARQLRIDRFAAGPPSAVLGGLQDPYAGVGAQARFGWQPQDVFGNRLLAQQHIDVDVGYTDDLIGLSQWPAVVTGYRFAGTPGAATVEVGVALDASAYVPAPGEVFTPVAAPGTASLPVGVAAQATAHRDRYAAVFWQLSHDLAAEVTTTVDNTAHPADVAALAAFASGAWSYLATVAGTTQLTAITAAHDTLASIAATYQVSAAELAQANRSPAQSFAAASLLNPSATIAVERRCTAVANDTLAGIAQRSPVPADPAGLAAGNPALALQPGTLLALGTVRTVAAGDTLASIAAAAGLDRTQLASANGPVTGLLEPGTAITPDYQAAAGDTLAGIAGRLSLTLREVAAAVDAAGAGALAPGAGIVVPLPVPVAGGDTLADIASRFAVTAAELGETNADADALSPGAAVVLPDGSQVTAAAHDTLGSIAAAHGTTAGDLAAANATAGRLLRPGAVLTSGYRARAGDTPGGVAAAFGLTAAALGAANAEVPGLLAADQPVLLGQDSRPVGQGGTLASIAADAGVTVASLAAANATGTACSSPVRPSPCPATSCWAVRRSRPAPPTRWARSPAAAACRRPRWAAPTPTSPGCWPAGVGLSYTPPGAARPYATTTTAHDTLSTVALRLQPQLAADGISQQVSPALLAEANQQVACLVPGAALLVPPADVTLSAPVTASNPAVVFALETAVTLRRTAHVDPALAAAGAAEVASVTTQLAPAPPDGAAGQSLALQQFASAFESAFTTPRLKLATTGSGSSGTQTQQLFAVQYGTPALSYTIGGRRPSTRRRR